MFDSANVRQRVHSAGSRSKTALRDSLAPAACALGGREGGRERERQRDRERDREREGGRKGGVQRKGICLTRYIFLRANTHRERAYVLARYICLVSSS